MNATTWNKPLALLLLAGMSAGASAQLSTVRLNEFQVDAHQSSDARRQFIELIGCAGTSLDGLAIIVINSVNTSGSAYTTEIDESFYFADSKYKLNGSSGTGYFVLWSGNSDSLSPDDQALASDIWGQLPNPGITRGLDPNFGDLEFASPRYESSFEEVRNVPVGETAGTIANDNSTTILLIDWDASVAAAAAASATLTLSDIEKDVDPDSDDDGILEGDLAYLVVIDEFAWSHNGGHEYTVSEANEWDFSSGFNIEAASRVNNTSTGSDTDRYISDGGSSDTYRQVYANWQAGEMVSWPAMAYQDGFGNAPRPAAMGTTTVDDSNGSTGNYGLAGVNLTPGLANETAQISASCRLPAGGADRNGDGVVNFHDLMDAAQSGEEAVVREVLEALR